MPLVCSRRRRITPVAEISLTQSDSSRIIACVGFVQFWKWVSLASARGSIRRKPRGSRGKGLRSITHAAVSLGLLEYAQENDLPHPGFLVIDSPLLAYFKPEGDDDLLLRGSSLKEKFYEYLVQHHSTQSQIIIIENQHPPAEFQTDIHMTVFTNNPSEGRAGFL